MGSIFGIVTKELTVLLVAMLPLIELRGAIPIGVSMGMNPIHVTILGVLGSLLPVPFLLACLKPVVLFFREKKLFKKQMDFLIQRTIRKSHKIKKYSAVGLLIFVAIPLPSTGVWSGCLAAVIFNIPYRTALAAITVGNVLAGMIMLFLSHTMISV